MDTFTIKEFAKVSRAEIIEESEAWQEVTTTKREELGGLELRCIMDAGMAPMAKIVKFAQENGLDKVVHIYAVNMTMAGFGLGYRAGKEAMLGKIK